MTEKEIIRCLKRAIIREVYRVICTKLSTPQPRDLRRDELKALRIAKQLTQVVVAEHLGCAPARISDIETGVTLVDRIGVGLRKIPEKRLAHY